MWRTVQLQNLTIIKYRRLVAAMQWLIPIPIRKLHVLLVLAQFKYHFTILLSTLKEKVCFDLDFISYSIWWWICENLVTTEHVHCCIIHKPVQKDSVFIAFGCMHPLLLYNWCFFFFSCFSKYALVDSSFCFFFYPIIQAFC